MMTPQHLIIAAVLFMITIPVYANEQDCRNSRTPHQERDADTIRRIEHDWLAAEYHGDAHFLDCLLAPGYAVIVSKDKATRTKGDLLARVAQNKGKTPEIPPLDTIVVVNGDFATAYSLMQGHKKTGEPYESRFVDSYVFKGGAWSAIAGVDL
jgi:hypothetical protein